MTVRTSFELAGFGPSEVEELCGFEVRPERPVSDCELLGDFQGAVMLKVEVKAELV